MFYYMPALIGPISIRGVSNMRSNAVLFYEKGALGIVDGTQSSEKFFGSDLH